MSHDDDDKGEPAAANQNATDTENSAPKASPLAEKSLPNTEKPPPQTPEWNDEERGYYRGYLCTQWALVFITLVGIILAICTLRSLNDSVGAANSQATAAQQQLELSERAWVVINGFEFVRLNRNVEKFMGVTKQCVPTTKFSIDYIADLENSGNGVAKDGNMFTLVVGDNKPSLAKYADTACSCVDAYNPKLPYNTGFVLARGAKVRIEAMDTRGGNDVPSGDLDLKHPRFVVLGCIGYRDQFNKVRHTRFCFAPHTVLPPSPDAFPAPIHFRHCEFAEDAD
jgi:hypothetical protein